MFPYFPQRVGATCTSIILSELIPVTRCHKDLISQFPGELLHTENYSRQVKITVIPGRRPVLGWQLQAQLNQDYSLLLLKGGCVGESGGSVPHPCSLLCWILKFLGAGNRCLARCVIPNNSLFCSPLGWFMIYRRAPRSSSSKLQAQCGTGRVHHLSRRTARDGHTWDGHVSDRAPLCPSAVLETGCTIQRDVCWWGLHRYPELLSQQQWPQYVRAASYKGSGGFPASSACAGFLRHG